LHYPELFDAPDYVHEVTSARLLGRDLRQLLDEPATERALQILEPEADEQGQRLLAQQSRVDTGLAVTIIAGFCEGLRHLKRLTP
jgi:hypothetical protein